MFFLAHKTYQFFLCVLSQNERLFCPIFALPYALKQKCLKSARVHKPFVFFLQLVKH